MSESKPPPAFTSERRERLLDLLTPSRKPGAPRLAWPYEEAIDAALAEIDRLRAERDAAIRVSLVWSEERGWHVGNPFCFERNQAQRLYAIREWLRSQSGPAALAPTEEAPR